jgi:hypothetical protein
MAAPVKELMAAGLLVLSGCRTGSARQDVAAVITNPTAQSRAELVRAVSQALNGATVTVADDALTRDSTLVIERARVRDAGGRRVDGRELGRPERFRLVKNGSRCVLVHEPGGKRWMLRSATCAPRTGSSLAPP